MTVGGFGARLMSFDFPLIADFGIITLVTVFFGLASTLIVLPPMMVLADSWLEKRSTQAAAENRKIHQIRSFSSD